MICNVRVFNGRNVLAGVLQLLVVVGVVEFPSLARWKGDAFIFREQVLDTRRANQSVGMHVMLTSCKSSSSSASSRASSSILSKACLHSGCCM